MKYFRLFLMSVIVNLSVLFVLAVPICFAQLTAGQTYTVTIDQIMSDGTVTILGLSTDAVADENGKITFSIGGLPTRSTCNFLLVTIQDSDGNTVRQSIVPAPAAGSSVNFGASPMTYAQTRALLDAMETAGSDDPVMALFGFVLVRSGAYDSTELGHLGDMGRTAIIEGFNVYLLAQTSEAIMATFKSAIVDGMTSYSSLIKDAVDTIDTGGTGADERGQAAAYLSQILIDAANTAGFDVGLINAAMRAASDQVEQYLLNTLDPSGDDDTNIDVVDKIMSATYMKISAERIKKKYLSALTTLGATGYATQVNTAVNTLMDTMIAQFEAFEAMYDDEEVMPDPDTLKDTYESMESDIDDAFNTFMSDIQASAVAITTMIAALDTAFDVDLTGQESMFTYTNPNGDTVNWAITTVSSVTWVVTNHSGDFTYTRDTTQPPDIMQWLPDDGANGRERRDFDAMGMPAVMAALFGLREDVEIVEMRKEAGNIAASWDITTSDWTWVQNNDPFIYNEVNNLNNNSYAGARLQVAAGADTDDDDADGVDQVDFMRANDLYPFYKTAEDQAITTLYLTRMGNIRDNIGGTLTAAEKQALIDLALPPSF